VSLLDRLRRGHLSDQQFARLWTSEERHPHLDACSECRARFAELDGWVLGVGEALRAEADDAFPAERLAVQQAQIARRLETLERPARVITFPKAARAVISGNSHVRRWVTVAAAGLIAGIGLGQVVPLRTVIDTQQAAAPSPNFSVPETVDRAKELTPVPASTHDEELLSSDAFASPSVKNLSALDDMTPHARDHVTRK